MEVLRKQLLLCLPLLAFISVFSSARFCNRPIFVNLSSQVRVDCRTYGDMPSTAVCMFFLRGSSNNIEWTTNTDRKPSSDGMYRIYCTFLANVRNLTDGYRYYIYLKVYPDVSYEEAQAVTINMTEPFYFERPVIHYYGANDQNTGPIIVDQGRFVEFFCSAEGHPGVTIAISRGSTVYQSSVSGELEYAANLRCETMGTYTCEASNGRSAEMSIDIYVRCPLRLDDESEYNKTFDGILDSLNKSISVNVTGYPGPRQYMLLMYDKTVVNEQITNETVVNGTAVNGTAWTPVPLDKYELDFPQSSTDISVYIVTLKFLDDKDIDLQGTQYILVLRNGMDELLFPFTLSESSTADSSEPAEDFPVLAVALGVAGGVVGLVLIGCGAYLVHRNFFKEE